MLPDHFGLWFLLVCGLAGIVAAVVGVVRLIRTGLALKKRIAGYGDLALRVDVQLAQRRVAIAQRRIDTVPALAARAERAFTDIVRARDRVLGIASSLVRIFRRPLRP